MSSDFINYVNISVTCILYLMEKCTLLMSCLRIAYRCIKPSKSRSRFKFTPINDELAVLYVTYRVTVRVRRTVSGHKFTVY